MRYLLLIYNDDTAEVNFSPEAMAPWEEYHALATSRGVLQDGAPLQRTSAGKTVRVRNGETLITDGPFVESKEQVGGYYVFDCKDEAEVLELAAKIPAAKDNAIEVRPLVCFDE